MPAWSARSGYRSKNAREAGRHSSHTAARPDSQVSSEDRLRDAAVADRPYSRQERQRRQAEQQGDRDQAEEDDEQRDGERGRGEAVPEELSVEAADEGQRGDQEHRGGDRGAHVHELDRAQHRSGRPQRPAGGPVDGWGWHMVTPSGCSGDHICYPQLAPNMFAATGPDGG
jgi:hypothetical protein